MIWQEFRKGTGDSDFFPGRLIGKTSKDGGLTWNNYRVVVENDPGDVNVMEPSLLRLPDGAILLSFLRNHSFEKSRSHYPPISAFVWVSRDEGKSFSQLATLWREKSYSLCNSTLRTTRAGFSCRSIATRARRKATPTTGRRASSTATTTARPGPKAASGSTPRNAASWSRT